MSETVLAVIAQGGRRLALGEYLLASVALAVTGQVMDTGRPTLGFGMTLHPSDIAALRLEADPHDLPAAVFAAAASVCVRSLRHEGNAVVRDDPARAP